MLSRLRSHVGHNLVGYIALFIALSGTAYAAKPLLTGADIQDNSLTGADVQDNSLKGADVDESSLGKVGDANTLDNFDSADYGAAMSGHITGLCCGTEYGAPTGISTASADEDPVTTFTPDQALQARDLSVQVMIEHPGGGDPAATRQVQVWINHGVSSLGCTMVNGEDSCTASGPVPVPASSTISIQVVASGDQPPADVALVAFRLTP